MTLTNEEFIRRFALHILPKHFVKIRHCGILSSTWKRQKLKALQEKMQIRLPELKAIEQPERICSCCKVGKLHHHSILRQTWPTANRYRHGPKESESIGQPPKILSGGVVGLVLKSEQKGHISVLNHRKKKRTLKSHRQKFKISSRQPHKNRSRSTGVSWHARWAPRNFSC